MIPHMTLPVPTREFGGFAKLTVAEKAIRLGLGSSRVSLAGRGVGSAKRSFHFPGKFPRAPLPKQLFLSFLRIAVEKVTSYCMLAICS